MKEIEPADIAIAVGISLLLNQIIGNDTPAPFVLNYGNQPVNQTNMETGTTVLAGGSAHVPWVIPSDHFLWSAYENFNGAPGSLRIANVTSSGFDIISSSGTDASTVRWFLQYLMPVTIRT